MACPSPLTQVGLLLPFEKNSSGVSHEPATLLCVAVVVEEEPASTLRIRCLESMGSVYWQPAAFNYNVGWRLQESFGLEPGRFEMFLKFVVRHPNSQNWCGTSTNPQYTMTKNGLRCCPRCNERCFFRAKSGFVFLCYQLQ